MKFTQYKGYDIMNPLGQFYDEFERERKIRSRNKAKFIKKFTDISTNEKILALEELITARRNVIERGKSGMFASESEMNVYLNIIKDFDKRILSYLK